ncbi:MAG: adenylosuccinate synthetase [Nanoarchaeota archaeon]
MTKTQILDAFIGLQWGDEGKGKVVDEGAADAVALDDGQRTIVVRAQGGPNAGHTIKVNNSEEDSVTTVQHSAPSGLSSGADIAIGPHVAFSPTHFAAELHDAEKLFAYNGRVMISERAGVLFEYHGLIDKLREEDAATSVGSTKNGIGPFYEDNSRKTTRVTFRDYVSPDFPDRLRKVMEMKRGGLEPALAMAGTSFDDCLARIVATHAPLRRDLATFAERLEYRLREYLERGDHILVEGAQGSGLDVDMGTIPDTTSSHLLAPSFFPSLGLPRRAFRIIGVEKVYPTRVGKGEMPTLDIGYFGTTVQRDAREFGATTGRPRRVGYPDWVLVKYSVMLNDCDGIVLTRVDDVQGHELKVCTAYIYPDGSVNDEFPLDLKGINPIYGGGTFSWSLWEGIGDNKIKDARRHYVSNGKDLPSSLLNFIARHDAYVGCPAVGVSIGPARGEIVAR